MRMNINVDAFWSKVRKESCWIWTAAINEKGYGVVGVGGVTKKAHRVAWEIANGPIKHGACVLHRCDNPPCCNPAHLFLGSRADNNADMLAKGRKKVGGTVTPVAACAYRRGSEHGMSKLTPTIVIEMRRDRAGGMSYSLIAKKYGVVISAAFKACTKKTWSHVP